MAVASRYHDDNVEYTADLRGNSCNQAVLQRMPKGTPINSLIFHGSPDMLIKYKPISIQNEDVGIGCIETKKNDSTTYNCQSMIPQQAGQLVCYIYQMIVAQMINNVMAGKVCEAGVGYGLYIMRSNGKCLLFKVTLSSEPLVVSAKIYYSVRYKPAVLCRALEDLASCFKS